MHAYALELDIKKRRKRLEKLRELQKEGPAVVADVVQASRGEGNATVQGHVTVRGIDEDYLRREGLIKALEARLEQLQDEYAKQYAEAVRIVERCPFAEIRCALDVVALQGGSYADAAGEFAQQGVPKDSNALRMAVSRYLDSVGIK